MSFSCLDELPEAHAREAALYFSGTHRHLRFIHSTLGTSDKAILYAHHKARDGPANLTQHCRLGIDSVFVQSLVRSLQHDNVLFHAGTNVCDTMGVLYQKHHRFLGFCRVDKGKNHIAACSLIPRG